MGKWAPLEDGSGSNEAAILIGVGELGGRRTRELGAQESESSKVERLGSWGLRSQRAWKSKVSRVGGSGVRELGSWRTWELGAQELESSEVKGLGSWGLKC